MASKRGRWLALLTVSAGLLGTPAAVGGRTTASNKRAAERDAPQLLAALALPPGASSAVADPSRSSVLGQAPSRPATPNLVDVHKFWRVPGGPQAALAWIQAHPPAGSTRDMSGESLGTNREISRWDGYAFAPLAAVLSSRVLLVTAARAAGGGTALRADAQVVWVSTRPAWEHVPGGVKLVTLTVRRPGKPTSAPRTVTGAMRVDKIVALVNALPLMQPGAVACPADVGPLVKLDFRRARGLAPVATAVADRSGCGGVRFRLGGRSGPTLAGSPRVIRLLSSLLRLNLG
jgi:hypothetical protein